MRSGKAFAFWLAVAGVVFSLSLGAYHAILSSGPRKVLIVVDASFPMRSSWDLVPGAIASLAGKRYERYALATDKALLHGYRETPDLQRAVPYGPRNLAGLSGRLPPEAREADEIVLVTDAPPEEARKSGIGRIVRP